MSDMNDSLSVYAEFSANYLPDLFCYVVPIHIGDDKLGSGVLVNYQGRHIVATAKHCIENKPRVFVPTVRIGSHETVRTRQLRVIRVELHDELDIGYLEIEDPNCHELQTNQLCQKRIMGGMVHVIGYPSVMAFVDWSSMNFSVCGAAFGTTLIEETDEYLKFDYPKQGSKFDPVQKAWMPSLFPESPHGFSGGGCFGVASSIVRRVQIIEYKLLGIQYAWSEDGRWVKVIPISHLCDLLAR